MTTNAIRSTSASRARPPDRRIGLRFTTVARLAQAFQEGIQHGYLAVPSDALSPTGHRVEVALTLPGCGRMLIVPTVVERTLSAGADHPRLLVLRLQGVGRALPRLVRRYLDSCRGCLCGEAGAGAPGVLPCRLLAEEDHAGWQQRARQEAEASLAASDPAHTPAPARPGGSGVPAGRAPTLTDGDSVTKASVLVREASRALAANNRAKALRLLRLAVTFDPHNSKAAALLRFSQGRGQA